MPSSPNRTCGSRNQNALAGLIPKSLNDEKLPMRHVTYERIGLTWITLYITTLAYQNDDLYNCHHSIVLEHSTSMTYLIVFGMRRTDECLYKLSSSSRSLEGDSSKTDEPAWCLIAFANTASTSRRHIRSVRVPMTTPQTATRKTQALLTRRRSGA